VNRPVEELQTNTSKAPCTHCPIYPMIRGEKVDTKNRIASKTTRGELLLAKIAQATGMTAAGADFLIANLDPFHDNQLKDLSGWPDEETAPSVIRIIKQSVTLATPTPASQANWDAMITAYPFVDPKNFYPLGRTNGQNVIDAATAGAVHTIQGGVSMHRKTSSSASFNLTADAFGVPITLDRSYSQGSGRLIGYAFEVINTTSELYKQGLCTVYRQSQPLEDSGTWCQLTAPFNVANYGYFTGRVYRQPPLNSADALLYPGSRQWRAQEGCYVVAPFAGGDNPPTCADYTQPILTTADDLTSDQALNTSTVYAPAYTTIAVGTVGSIVRYDAIKHNPYHMVGAFFDGLSASTTLQVNVNFIYETFPAVSERDILVLAKPSCQYDPIALSALSQVLSSLPVGVPSSMNAGGDWFYDLVSTIAEYAPKVGDLIPGGKLIGQGVGSLAKLGLDYMTPPGDTSVKPQVKEVKKQKRENQQRLQNKTADARQAIKDETPNRRKGNQQQQPKKKAKR